VSRRITRAQDVLFAVSTILVLTVPTVLPPTGALGRVPDDPEVAPPAIRVPIGISQAAEEGKTSRPTGIEPLRSGIPQDDLVLAGLVQSDFSLQAVPVDPLDRWRGLEEPFEGGELVLLLEAVGFAGEGLRSAWAVVMKESDGDPGALNLNRRTGDASYGLFQINMIDSLGVARRREFSLSSNDELFDPVRNAQIAFEISRGGTDFGPWGIGPNAYRGSRVGSYPRWHAEFPRRDR